MNTTGYRPSWILIPALAVLASFGWAYWSTLMDLSVLWSSDPQYSHGYLIPIFAVCILWMRRQQAPVPLIDPSWWGLPLMAAVLIGWVVAARYSYLTPDNLSILPVLATTAVVLGGWPLLRWSWPAVAFLAFMLPLHPRMKAFLTQPLQRIATDASAFLLQTMGFNAQSEGTILYLTDVELGIVEACSGLRMLMLFFALTTAVIIVKRPRWYETLILVVSAAPIAVLSNIVRITVTAMLHELVGSHAADLVFHDLAGWFMVLLGVALFWLELKLLPLFIEPVAPAAPVLAGVKGPTIRAQPVVESGVAVDSKPFAK